MTYLHQIDPIALSLGPLKIHWYGLMYLLAFASAWWLGRKRIRAGRLPGTDMNGFSDLLFYGMLGVVLGGRIGYMLFYSFGSLLENPLSLFKVWEGGMSFHGGLLGVMAAALWWTRKQKLHFFVRTTPLAALPGLPGRCADVRHPVVVLQQAAPALCGVGHVCVPVWRIPFPGGIRARAR